MISKFTIQGSYQRLIANTSNKNIRLNKSFTKIAEHCFDTVAFDLKFCELETNLP